MSIFYDTTSLLNISRQQQQSAKQEVKMLAESYEMMYEEDELNQLIDDLIAEGYSEEEIYDYLEEKMSDAEKRSLPARSRRKLGITGPGESKKGKPLTGSAKEASISGAQRYRKERRASQPPTERQQTIRKKALANFMSTVDRPTAPITKTSGEKKTPKERGAFRSGSRPKGVASYDLTDRANAVRLAAGREFQNKAAKSASIADLRKQYEAPGETTVSKLEKMVTRAQSTAHRTAKRTPETRAERKARVTANAPGRKERIAARRAAKNREVSDLKISTSDLKKKYYSAPSDRTTSNREMVMRGLKGGVKKYAGKVAGKIKKFFGKEEVDLFFASQIILEHEGYTPEEIEIILEWIDSGLEQDETFDCLTILENAIDDVLLCQFIVENFEVETEDDIEFVVEQMNDEDFEYVYENYIEE